MPDHLATVQAIYAAFGRGDVPAIVEAAADDVVWEGWGDNFAQQNGVPWMQARRGKTGVASFFQELATTMRVTHFEVLDIIPGERQVAVEFVIAGDVLATGKRFRDEEMHLWTFNDAGKFTRLRHYIDTAKHVAAAVQA